MTDIIMYQHMQQYRTGWYETRRTLREIEDIEAVDDHHARMRLHLKTKNWVRRLLPLEREGRHSEIWHDRQFADYIGLKQALEDGLRGNIRDPLPVDTLDEIADAAEEITVDAVDLPEQPPVDPDPWTASVDEIKDAVVDIDDLRTQISHTVPHEFHE